MLEKITSSIQGQSKLWKGIMVISIVLFMALLVAIAAFCITSRPARHSSAANQWRSGDGQNSATSSPVCPGCVRRQIDGVYVDPKVANLPPVAVMIDNHPDARPQSGIDKANLVYEAEVEGYYTRFMAVFASDDSIPKIGPVRSARPYFVAWAKELGAVYAHCGGSPEALVDIEKIGLTDLNEFYNGQFFWRDKAESAPHNVYISSDNFNKFFIKNNISAGDLPARQYKDDTPIKNASSSLPIAINYRVPEFRSVWVYDPTDNDYIRYADNQPVLTADKNLITAKNVIIQTVPAAAIDDKLRLDMQFIGQGPATICLDGQCQSGQWSKPTADAITTFSYANGNTVKFNAGPTWIEVMRP